MGWTGIPGFQKKGISQKAYLDQEFTSSNFEVLESHKNGREYYAAVKSHETNNVFALVVLCEMQNGEFCFKEMTEDVGPVYYNCPASIYNRLTPTTNEYALAWRNKVKQRI